MRSRTLARALLAAGGCAAAALLLHPAISAYSLLGTSLDFDQRDVRVFDNFGPGNPTPDPNWPGVVGAPLAIWKAVSEWGSELHGDGSGDPHQPFDVGSGGANYDAVWQGLAPGPGTAGSNLVFLSNACSGGIVSFTEQGPGGGWRMHMCSQWTWFQGPGIGVPPNAFDLQGVVAHEFGHVLGLGHSNVSGSTMFASLTGSGVAARSLLTTDDSLGLQAIYGPRSASKPHVASIAGTDVLTVTGTNFAPANNEVWFTELGGNPTGEPVRVVGLASSAGGTQIVLPLPANAGPGDLMVKTPGVSGATLSNGFPFDPQGCGLPTAYCEAKTNSQGCTPAIGFAGSPSATNPAPFLVTASGVINQKTGLLLYAFENAATPFQGGTLCLAAPLRRTPAQNSGGNVGPDDCSGTLSFDLNARIQSAIDPLLVAGAAVVAQYYYRDPADPFGVGLTDALALVVCP